MLEQRGLCEQVTAIVGLGNPGKQYERTRHNAGFRVLDLLAQDYSIMFQERKFRSSWGTGLIGNQKILLVKPVTFMNRSGEAVGEVARYFGIPTCQILVVHDDLDLPSGRLRLVQRGGAGGHRGVLSIVEHLGSQDFPRLKLGIGRPLHGESVESYVLQGPYSEEVGGFEEMIRRGADAGKIAITSGLSAAMNLFNR